MNETEEIIPENITAEVIQQPVPPPEETDKTAELEKKYDDLLARYNSLQKQNILETVSRETGCTDPEYLEFCAIRRGISVHDPDALRNFARELSAVSPGCFQARIIPGSSAGTAARKTPCTGNMQGDFSGDRIGLIALSVDSAPDAVYR